MLEGIKRDLSGVVIQVQEKVMKIFRRITSKWVDGCRQCLILSAQERRIRCVDDLLGLGAGGATGSQRIGRF